MKEYCTIKRKQYYLFSFFYLICYNIIGDGMENKNFEDYENIKLIYGDIEDAEVVLMQMPEKDDLKDIPVVEGDK